MVFEKLPMHSHQVWRASNYLIIEPCPLQRLFSTFQNSWDSQMLVSRSHTIPISPIFFPGLQNLVATLFPDIQMNLIIDLSIPISHLSSELKSKPVSNVIISYTGGTSEELEFQFKFHVSLFAADDLFCAKYTENRQGTWRFDRASS